MHVLGDLLGLCLAQPTALDTLGGIALEPFERAIERRLRDVDEMECKTGNGALEVIADIRPDGAGADDNDPFGQPTRRLVQEWIGVGHGSETFRLTRNV